MEQYLIDTNVVSDYFSASLPANGLLFMDSVIDAIPKLSVISQIELLCLENGCVNGTMCQRFYFRQRCLQHNSRCYYHKPLHNQALILQHAIASS